MRSQCSICAELFEKDSTISAIHCGHTFHKTCLQEWLSHQATCPQCRTKAPKKQIIEKLYFDPAEDEEIDVPKIKNELDEVKLQLRQKDKEKSDLMEDNKSLQKRLEKLEDNRHAMEISYKEERGTNSALTKQLRIYERQMTEADFARTDAKKVRKKLEDLQNVQLVIDGCEEDISDLLKGDPKQLATYCAVLKKELRTKTQQCRSLRTESEKIQKDMISKTKIINERKKEAEHWRETARVSEEDIKNLEKENRSLKNKIDSMSKAMGSPNTTAESFAHRLLFESPAPMPPPKRPRLSNPCEGSFDLDTSADLFAVDTPSPPEQKKKDSPETGTQYLKISSAASSNPVPSKQRKVQDISNLPATLGTMNLFKNKPGIMPSSAIRTGFNGMGSHDKFVQPLGRPKPAQMKQKKVAVPKFGPSKSTNGKVPPFPSLGGFLSQT